MKKPDFPPGEQARIKILQSLEVLDTLPEERFDRLTRIAQRMFGVPIALVSLVDENRQWFKSCLGLGASETPRDISFCGHAILGNDVFIIPDTLEDVRFLDNPLVLNDPKIRFYAGCPLQVNHHRLGTLCLIDQAPRTFDREDVEALQDLAAMVEQELAAVQLATMDELTDISNRRGFLIVAQHTMNLCVRHDLSLSMVCLDLDRFKCINDNFGHAEGDYALVAFSNLMKRVFRNSDVFARFGGDEFVVLLSNTSKDQAGKIVTRFEESLTEHNKKANRGYDVSFSFGVVEFNSEKHALFSDFMAEADSLMYEKKQSNTSYIPS